MTQRITEMSPRFLARMTAFLGVLEGVASVNGQLRIPDRLVVTTDAAATAANILGNESLFRLGLAVCVLAVAFNSARTVLLYVLFRPVGRIPVLLVAFFGFCCMLVGYVVYKSTFLPRILGVLEVVAGVGYSTYLWPPLANYLYPYNLALGVGELALGFWLLVFGVNVERWKEQAAQLSVRSMKLVETES